MSWADAFGNFELPTKIIKVEKHNSGLKNNATFLFLRHEA